MWLVSSADKVHNARAIASDLRSHGLAVFDRFKGGRDGTIWYHETLASVFNRLPGPMTQELIAIVREVRGRADRLVAEMPTMRRP